MGPEAGEGFSRWGGKRVWGGERTLVSMDEPVPMKKKGNSEGYLYCVRI